METIFTSKANVLRFLSKNLKKAEIESMYDFTVSDWSNNKTEILREIRSLFNNRRVIVRSSAVGEDSVEKSDAGNYDSILNVPSQSERRLRTAIDGVIRSYHKKNNLLGKNQVLVQNQTTRVATSGVIFTRTEGVGAPYYTINYEDGPSTENVTKGKVNNTINIFKYTPSSKIPTKWRKLLASVKEIEAAVGSDRLDIEFALTASNKVVIFQVRPLTSAPRAGFPEVDAEVRKCILRGQRQFVRLSRPSRLFGDYTIFSDMADWNPAEIIGNHPNTLDYSLYDYLIMKSAWRRARKKLGYQDVTPQGLMVRFGSKPYVDTRASFNSLIPDTIPARIKGKLVDFFLEKLAGNPHLHDKVEFDILFTCYAPGLSKRLEEVSTLIDSERETVALRLLEFTNKILKRFPVLSRQCSESAWRLERRRHAILSSLESGQTNYRPKLDAVAELLRDCIRWGTIPFSIMARLAFIACTLLKSVAKEEGLEPTWVDSVLNSVRTPLSEFQEDYAAVCQRRLSQDEFFQKYGHLRPGTYDITALRYDQRRHLFDELPVSASQPAAHSPLPEVTAPLALNRYGLHCGEGEFLDFVRSSLRQREGLKFLFTKNLSEALELLARAGRSLGFEAADMAYLDIRTVLRSYRQCTEGELRSVWREEIDRGKKQQLVHSQLVLPPLIKSKDDFHLVTYFKAAPNFITNKAVSAETLYLSGGEETSDLTGKIILLDNADPGYDWIFTRHPAALITKYGGVASHMSIRCAEIGLPAAIGCGEILFGKLIHASKVLLDCANRQIITLEERERDPYMAAKRALKCLGYIR